MVVKRLGIADYRVRWRDFRLSCDFAFNFVFVYRNHSLADGELSVSPLGRSVLKPALSTELRRKMKTHETPANQQMVFFRETVPSLLQPGLAPCGVFMNLIGDALAIRLGANDLRLAWTIGE
jgi:hypothetical protein